MRAAPGGRMGRMSTEDRPPAVDGLEWESAVCPSCGDTWWLARDPDSPADLTVEAWAALLGECADCRVPADEPRLHVHAAAVAPNRAARRATRFNRRPL
jgi:hypothetical protein